MLFSHSYVFPHNISDLPYLLYSYEKDMVISKDAGKINQVYSMKEYRG